MLAVHDYSKFFAKSIAENQPRALAAAFEAARNSLPSMHAASIPCMPASAIAQTHEGGCAESCADELKDMAPVLPEADEVDTGASLHLTPSESMHPLGRIAAANSQLAAFTASLDAAKAHPTVHALLACQACISYYRRHAFLGQQ